MHEEAEWGVLPDIALRLKALVCNEAVSEGTNGTMRQLLGPFRLQMGREILLSRFTIAKRPRADALRTFGSVLPLKRGPISSESAEAVHSFW
jgi:hypothetical protein